MTSPATSPQPLTDRDRRILLLTGEGLTIQQIGDTLRYSPETIKSRLKILRREWGARTTADLVMLAMQAGAIE